MKKLLLYWGPTILWMGLIYYLSSEHAVVASTVKWQDFAVHKSAHVVIYFVLAVWMYRSLKFSTPPSSRGKLFFWTVVLTSLYAVTDEWHQSFTPTRTPALRDVMFDIVGASVGAGWVANIVYKQK